MFWGLGKTPPSCVCSQHFFSFICYLEYNHVRSIKTPENLAKHSLSENAVMVQVRNSKYTCFTSLHWSVAKLPHCAAPLFSVLRNLRIQCLQSLTTQLMGSLHSDHSWAPCFHSQPGGSLHYQLLTLDELRLWDIIQETCLVWAVCFWRGRELDNIWERNYKRAQNVTLNVIIQNSVIFSF